MYLRYVLEIRLRKEDHQLLTSVLACMNLQNPLQEASKERFNITSHATSTESPGSVRSTLVCLVFAVISAMKSSSSH